MLRGFAAPKRGSSHVTQLSLNKANGWMLSNVEGRSDERYRPQRVEQEDASHCGFVCMWLVIIISHPVASRPRYNESM